MYQLDQHSILHILFTHCIHVFRIVLRLNSDYFPPQHQSTSLRIVDAVCFLCSTKCHKACICPHIPEQLTVLEEVIKYMCFNCPSKLHISFFFNCCLSVHVDNYTIIIPTKCTSFFIKSTRYYNLYFLSLYS
jgi:hypothetical protein